METDIFSAGVVPGGPASESEVKMLLCYILSNTGQGMSVSGLYDALSECGLVNYFEMVGNMEKLVSSGHLLRHKPEGGESLYETTELGGQAAVEFTAALPLTVREKALGAAHRHVRRERRLAEVEARVQRLETGFLVELAIPEGETDLLRVSLFVPTEQEAGLIRKRFLNDPTRLYQGFLALLTGDDKVLGAALPQQEELF